MRLLKILKIHSSEAGMVAWVAGLMFFASFGGAVGSPGVESLFFSRFGVRFLPHMYILLGLIIVGASLGITALLGRVDSKRLYYRLPLVMAALLVISRILVAFDFRWFYPPLWLGMNVSWTLLSLFTWGLAALVCDARQAKRLFPLFSAAYILGLTAGGLLTRPLVAWVGTENLLLVWAAMLALAFFLARSIAGLARRGAGGQSRRGAASLLDEIKEGYQFTRSSPLLRWMAVAAVLFAIMYYSVVFPFSRGVAAQFPDENQITAFLGVFQGASTGLSFLLSLLLANRLYARFGYMTSILVYPVLYLAGFIAVILQPAFLTLVIFRFSQVLWSEGVSEGANQAMYNLAPEAQREQTRAFVRGVANPAGVSLVGVILLASERLRNPVTIIYFTGLAAAAATCYFVWRARGAYSLALVDALRRGQPHLFSAGDEPYCGFPRDATALRAVINGLSSPEAPVRRVSAEILANQCAPEAMDEIVAALDDDDPAVRAALVRSISLTGAQSAILEVASMLKDEDPQVRVAAIDALRNLAGYSRGLSQHLQPLLLDPDPAVVSRAAASLLLLGPHPEAEAKLRALAAHKDPHIRIIALQALVLWGSQSAYDIAAEALKDPLPAIRREAAAILARIDASQCIIPLVFLLGDEDPSVGLAAAQALGEIGKPAIETVLGVLHDPHSEGMALVALERLPVQPYAGKIEAYARDRAGRALRHHALWLASLSQASQTPALCMASDALRAKSVDEAKKALKAVSLLWDRVGIPLAIESLDSPQPAQRANALETLESSAKSGLVKDLLTLWEPEGDQAPAAQDWIAGMLADKDPWLRACAVLAAGDVDGRVARGELDRLARSDPDELVRTTSENILAGGSGMKTLQTLSLMEKILFLRGVPLFAELSPVDLRQVAGIAGEHLFADGEVISEQGTIGEEMYVIVSGEVRVVSHGKGGKAERVMLSKPGDPVGEMSIISRAPRIATLVAAGQVRALCIERADFEQILRQRPETSLAVMRVLCKRLEECVVNS